MSFGYHVVVFCEIKQLKLLFFSVKQLYTSIIEKWTSASASFCYPIIFSERTILNKVNNLLQLAAKYQKSNCNKKLQAEFCKKLDKLFDILSCEEKTCEVKFCSDWNCGGCQEGAHVDCHCLAQNKIPKSLLYFIK